MTQLMQLQERRRNQYSSNCSECRSSIAPQQGYLFKNTKYRTSKGYHVKCEDCVTGVTARRIREAEKAQCKTLSVTFAKKWCEKLYVKILKDEFGVYCEVYDNGTLILGYCNAFEGWQEYPTEDWCEEQAKKMKGSFSTKAIEYICETLTEAIQVNLAEGEILSLIEKDAHPFGLMPLNPIISKVVANNVERPHIEKALVRLNIQGKVELRTTKTGVAKSLGVDLVDIRGVKYGFLKYNRAGHK